MWADRAVVRFIGGTPLSREAAWSRFLRHPGLWAFLGFGFFAVVERETGRLVGQAGFHDLRRDLVPSIEGTLEAGWVIAPAAQGRGYAREAMEAALAWADRAHPTLAATAIIVPEHAASLHLAGRLGFAPVAHTTFMGGPIVVLRRPPAAAG